MSLFFNLSIIGNNLKKDFISGLTKGAGIFIAIVGLLATAVFATSSWSDSKTSEGALTATSWDTLVGHIEGLQTQGITGGGYFVSNNNLIAEAWGNGRQPNNALITSCTDINAAGYSCGLTSIFLSSYGYKTCECVKL